jgi:HEPN domain-containing protein
VVPVPGTGLGRTVQPEFTSINIVTIPSIVTGIMSKQDDAIARKWIKQALHDLEMADKNITIEGYDIAAFLSHQAVEKLFKGLIAQKGRPVPKSHYIDELGATLHLPDEIYECVIDLSSDYQFARYPDISDSIPYEQYDKTLATERVNSAQKIFEHLRNHYSILLEKEP